MNGGLGAVFRAAAGGLGGRKLQAVIIGMVVLTATAASTLALGMLADAHSPFDHAFAQQNGAHVAVTVDTSVASATQIAAATKVTGVTAVAGPFEAEPATAKIAVPGVSGSGTGQLTFVGRSSPSSPVDDLAVQQGHWAVSDSQVVVSDTGNAPPQLGATITIGSQALTVVGIADSITNTADAWVLPAEMAAIAGSGGSGQAGTTQASTGQAQLLYRFSSNATAGNISADINEIKAALPSGALQNAVSYLNVRQSEESSVAPWVPFIIAFGVIALVISVLIVVNVVGGAVVAGTTRIGVLKSIGFTPGQVVGAYVLLVAVPAVTGTLAGVICGNLFAVPLYQENAQVYQVGGLGVPFWVDLAVPVAILLLTVAAAFGPSLRAGRMSPVQAIATGRAPKPKHGFFAQRALARLTSVPRPVTLGLASPAARPGRTLVTLVAVLFGAVAVTFGVGLSISLSRAFSELTTIHSLPVAVSALSPGSGSAPGYAGGPAHFRKRGSTIVRVGGGALSPAQQQTITTAIGQQPGTLHYLSVFEDSLSLPGVSDSVGAAQVTAYGHGDPSWSGLALITGGWYSSSSSAREAVVNTLFLTETGTSVGGTYTIVNGNHRVTVRIVGEVFAPGNSIVMLISPATLGTVDPSAGSVAHYAIAVRPGVNPRAYANQLQATLGGNYGIGAGGGGAAKSTLAITTLVGLLTLLIIVVAGLGVLNTVALQIRERTHDIGIFKALGMTPRQTLTLVVCSVGITGLVAGVIAVPAGILLHHSVIPAMVHAANSGYPPNLMSVYSLPEMLLLALAGLAIALAGALAPASWAARSRTAAALRTE